MSLRAVTSRLLHNGRLLLRILRPQRDVLDGFNNKILPRGVELESVSPRSVPAQVSRYLSLQQHARRLFINNVIHRITNTLAGDLRQRTAKSVFVGDSAPFFALVGVSLASGAGILTKDEELEIVCKEIRQAVSKVQFPQTTESAWCENEAVNLKNIELGPVIAKGCNAVVYSARKAQQEGETCEEFPLAVKMMFNYDAESNSSAILRAMYRETVPSRQWFTDNNSMMPVWEQRRVLPPHPNVVEMYCAFADQIPAIPGSLHLYPDALPARINPQGSGRNMSLFLLMKRYECSLKEYLFRGIPNQRVSLLLLTQLLEAVAHMSMHGIAHRDLKSDNILVDLSNEKDDASPSPLLVVTDFGCCLADKDNGLVQAYTSPDIDKGGNVALMPPEVACARPGSFMRINYSRADVWTVATLAYELYGMENPFYRMSSATYNQDDLPKLPDTTPVLIERLVANLLHRDPHKRLSGELAATICQLILWCPRSWLPTADSFTMPSSTEILQWLLCLTTKVLCEGKKRNLPEYQLIASFMSRVKLHQVKYALDWVHNY